MVDTLCGISLVDKIIFKVREINCNGNWQSGISFIDDARLVPDLKIFPKV
jgi:hypothetical protein